MVKFRLLAGLLTLLLVWTPVIHAQTGQQCGDVNQDDFTDVGDLTSLIDFLFLGGDPPQPVACVGNVDAAGGVDIGDLTHYIEFLFLGGVQPAVDCCPGCQDGEIRPCYTGPPATQNVGACTDGLQTCSGGAWGPCEGEVTPTGESCDNIDNDCDGAVDNNAVCTDVPNATTGCTVGGCQILSCDPGYYDCDSILGTGCEMQITDPPPYTILGTVCGDRADCDQFLPTFLELSNHGPWVVEVSVLECCESLFNGENLGIAAVLTVPSDADYDLRIYESDGVTLVGESASSGLGVDEDALYQWPDNLSTDESRVLYIEIVFSSGTPCADWELDVYGSFGN